MSSNFEKVKEFHYAFEVPMPSEPCWPDIDTVQLRIKLIQEEVDEWEAEAYNYIDAIEFPSSDKSNFRDMLANAAKELADILYVVYGAGETLGIDMDKVFAEVHRSNMTKLGADGKPVRRKDGKVLKGPNYEVANVKKVLFGDE